LLEEKVKELTDELDAVKIVDRVQISADDRVMRIEAEFEQKLEEHERLQRSCLKYKTLLDEKYKDYDRLKKDYEGIFKELVILKERQNQSNEAGKVKYYKRKLEEKNQEVNTIRKKKMSETNMRKSHNNFEDVFKKVR
jgi:hypothetical protein